MSYLDDTGKGVIVARRAVGDWAVIEPFAYRFIVTKVVDGDTLDVNIDMGFQFTLNEQRLRLLGVNTPETKGPTREAGLRAKAFTREWLSMHTNLVIQSRKRDPKHAEKDAFGRYLVLVYGDGADGRQACLNDDLLASKNAVPFMEGS